MDAVAEPSLLATTRLSLTRPYRLGLDLGSNSIGWFIVWLERDEADDRWRPVGLGPGGVRIFPDGRDPQSGTSNAVDRRQAKSMRVRRDRLVRRQKALIEALVRHSLMPEGKDERKTLESLDPYELRAKALEGPLPAHHVGRALFHLNQRRGFLSNRKAERKDNESGAIKEGETKLKRAMAEEGAETLGVFLWRRHRKREGVRARGTMIGTKVAYDFYPTRDLALDEFRKIWAAQAPHHATMTEAARDEIEHIIFYQRPLKPPVVGKCALDPATESAEKDPEGYRCPWSHPLAQRFRIFQEVRNLEVGEVGEQRRKLTKEEGDRIAMALFANGKLTFDKIRGELGLPPEARFNIESERRPHLDGDALHDRFSKKDRFGKRWAMLDLDTKIEVVERLEDEEDEGALVAWLVQRFDLDEATARKIAATPLPESHCRLGLRAIRALLAHLEAGLRYDEAAKAAGYDHAKGPTGELSPTGKLPYYGAWLQDAVVGTADPRDPPEVRYGRFPNPTVHIGLNQLRRVVNELIDAYGAPTEIVVEFTRALKLSHDQKREIERKQRQDQARNDSRRQKLAGLGIEANQRNLMKMRLWEELNLADEFDRKCPYTGEQIGISTLFSEAVDIDHLIPFSVSLDDSAANKIVCMRYANRHKRQKTPFEAFGASRPIDGFVYDWEEIRLRAAGLPKNKRWRFEPDAMSRFDKEGGFVARQLNETGWLARLAKQYLSAVCDPYSIWVLPGRLTAMIRAKWGLNDLLPDARFGGVEERVESFQAATDAMEFSGIKNRADHRHHAIDGLVAALTDRSLFWKMARTYDEDRQKIEIPKPWESLRDDLKSALETLVVSHKPDHGPEGQLHEDTAYGLVSGEPERDADGKPLGNLVYRKPLTALNDNEIERIRDRRLRDKVREHVFNLRRESTNMTLADALHNFAEEVKAKKVPGLVDGISRVRILKPEKPEYLVPVTNGSDVPYKAYSAGENHCVEIYEMPDGKWQGEAVRRFDANQKDHQPRWRTEVPGAKLVMRVHKGDTLRLEIDGKTKIMVVHRLDASASRFKLAEHNETGNLDRRHAMDNEIDPFRWLMASYSTLKRANAARVRVDPIGRVWNVREKDA